MYSLLHRHVKLRSLHELIRCYSLGKKSHYEVLKLKKNCSDKQIKEAFIKLSKEFHPDKNKDSNAQQQFVKIVEAYNVLGKPSSRARYDSMIDVQSPHNFYTKACNKNYNAYNSYKETFHSNKRQSPPNQESYNSNYGPRAKQSTNDSETYYGGLGVKRIPNYVLILLCVGIAFVGTLFQVFVIREMYVVQRRQALERSKYLSEELEKVRAAARGNTNEMQTRMLLEKIVGSSNPTIATASLGQALASEKK